MKFDDLPSTWQEQNNLALSPEDREAMLARVCRRVERMSGVIIRRDLIETVVAVALIFFFGRDLFSNVHPVARIGSGFLVLSLLFIIWKLHRARTIRRPAPIDSPVSEFCRIELERLDRQIQLLRGVLWWYLAPILVGVNIVFVGHGASRDASIVYGIFTFLLGWGLYALNRRAAKGLIPLRDELANLLRQLEGAGADALPATGQPVPSAPTRRQRLFAFVLSLTLGALGLAGAFLSQDVDYPKRAPFSGIRWEESEPVVRIGEEWYTLVALDGVPAEEIVAFSRRTYWLRWKKRFEEDLVEVLTRMGHEPGETVRLVVRPLGGATTQTLEDVPMTEANRQTIYRAAPAHEH